MNQRNQAFIKGPSVNSALPVINDRISKTIDLGLLVRHPCFNHADLAAFSVAPGVFDRLPIALSKALAGTQ